MLQNITFLYLLAHCQNISLLSNTFPPVVHHGHRSATIDWRCCCYCICCWSWCCTLADLPTDIQRISLLNWTILRTPARLLTRSICLRTAVSFGAAPLCMSCLSKWADLAPPEVLLGWNPLCLCDHRLQMLLRPQPPKASLQQPRPRYNLLRSDTNFLLMKHLCLMNKLTAAGFCLSMTDKHASARILLLGHCPRHS